MQIRFRNYVKNKKFILVLISLCLFWNFYHTNIDDAENIFIYKKYHYISLNSKCQVPDIYPFETMTVPRYPLENYKACRTVPLLTKVIKQGNDKALLTVNTYDPVLYNRRKLHCCYSTITRSGSVRNPDNEI